MKVAFAFFLLTCSSHLAFANEFPVQARLFAGATSVDPSNLNQELVAQGLQEYKNIGKLGVEITYSVARFLDVGLNYAKRSMAKDETDSSPSTDYQALLNQDSIMLVGRIPFLKSDFFRLDAFVGIGGSNTTLKLKTATQDGELSKRESGDWFASLCSAYGISAAVGYKKVYLVLEGGFESNKVESLKRTGTINDNIQTIDLSGGYASIGLLFDGIPARAK